MENDQLLINDFLATRSESAFSELYRQKTPSLYQMALRLTSRNIEAEELVQKTWIKAIDKLKNFKSASTLKTWLIGIMINLFREQNRQDQKLKKTDDHLILNSGSVKMAISDTIDLENAIQQLSAGYKEILLLHDVEGYTHKEIAAMLDIADGTSKSQLFQARKILRKYLVENHKTQ